MQKMEIENAQALVDDVEARILDNIGRYLNFRKAEHEHGLAEVEDDGISSLKRELLESRLQLEKFRLENEKLRLEAERAKLEAEKLEAQARAHRARSQIPATRPPKQNHHRLPPHQAVTQNTTG